MLTSIIVQEVILALLGGIEKQFSKCLGFFSVVFCMFPTIFVNPRCRKFLQLQKKAWRTYYKSKKYFL